MSEELSMRMQRYVREKLDGELYGLKIKRERDRSAVCEDQLARGFGLILDPLDTRFDEIEVEHFKAKLQICLDAWFEAYEAIGNGLVPDERIWKALNSFKQQSLDGQKMSLLQTASGIANRNSAPGIARANALGQELERSAHAFMKVLHCEIEMRRNMKRNATNEAQTNNYFTQINIGNATNNAMGPSPTILVGEQSVFNQIEMTIESEVQDGRQKAAIRDILEALRRSPNKSSFLETVSRFMGMVANCASIAPHVPEWMQKLHTYAEGFFRN
jgi:hypothetical protein